MAEAPKPNDRLGARRRKVRKGTRNCWECRKRKVRCVFAAPSADVCNNCRRRGTECISQELPDEPKLPALSGQVEARLARIEGIISTLGGGPHRSEAWSALSPQYSVTSTERAHSPSTPLTGDDSAKTPEIAFGDPSPEQRVPTGYQDKSGSRLDEVAQDLIRAWPTQRELDIICTLPASPSAHSHYGILSRIPQSLAEGEFPKPQDLFRLPYVTAHPVLIARKLLVLSLYLQAVTPSPDRAAQVDHEAIMFRVLDRAVRLVTTNDDLTGSVEGLECICIEALYHNYSGSLHRAWTAVHRAATLAQMLGLDRGHKSSSLKFLGPETRQRFQPEYFLFRLAYMDNYLSLMLGLPRMPLSSSSPAPTSLEISDSEQMQRLHARISTRILNRTDQQISDPSYTRQIDLLLRQAASQVPPQWWLMPDFSPQNLDGLSGFQDTFRLMDQFTHYHLVLRLHLPYMLRPAFDRRYDYSKTTIISTAREMISRYVAFGTLGTEHFFCSGTDLLAFVAITVMCLAHITVRSRLSGSDADDEAGDVLSFLVHSRQSDRGAMEKALEIVRSRVRAGTDAIVSKLAVFIRHLLKVEASAAEGTQYVASAAEEGGHDGPRVDYDGRMVDGDKVLRISIPCFGTVKFERGAVSKSDTTHPPETTTDSSGEATVPQAIGASLSAGQDQQQQDLSPMDDYLDMGGMSQDWNLQGIDLAIFDSLFRGAPEWDMP